MEKSKTVEKTVQSYKDRIRVVEKEMSKETDRRKKQRLNKYKQKLQIEWRNYTRGQ